MGAAGTGQKRTCTQHDCAQGKLLSAERELGSRLLEGTNQGRIPLQSRSARGGRPAARRGHRRRPAGSATAVAAQTVAAVTEEVPSYAALFSGHDGRQHRGRGAEYGAGRLPQASPPAAATRTEHAARPHAGGRLRLVAVEARRQVHGRAARRLPGRCPGRLAGDGRRRDQGRGRVHDGPLRRASLPTSTSRPRPASGIPTSCPPRGGSASATSTGWPEPALRREPTCARGQRGAGGLARAAYLTAVLLPVAQVRVLSLLGSGTLRGGRAARLRGQRGVSPLLVPDMEGRDRRRPLRVLAGRARGGGPAPLSGWPRGVVPACRAGGDLVPAPDPPAPLDTEDHLVDVVLGATPTRSPSAPASSSRWASLAGHRTAARGDAALLVAAPGQAGRRRRRPPRARADRALPDGAVARPVRRPARHLQVVLELLLALHPPAGEDVALPDDEDEVASAVRTGRRRSGWPCCAPRAPASAAGGHPWICGIPASRPFPPRSRRRPAASPPATRSSSPAEGDVVDPAQRDVAWCGAGRPAGRDPLVGDRGRCAAATG